MATEKQIAANRRNALKSTGPRTQEGKARSRGNALRHGLSVAGREFDRCIGSDGEVSQDTSAVSMSDYLRSIDAKRHAIFREINQLLEEQSTEVHEAVRRLAALDRYLSRGYSHLRRRLREDWFRHKRLN